MIPHARRHAIRTARRLAIEMSIDGPITKDQWDLFEYVAEIKTQMLLQLLSPLTT